MKLNPGKISDGLCNEWLGTGEVSFGAGTIKPCPARGCSGTRVALAEGEMRVKVLFLGLAVLLSGCGSGTGRLSGGTAGGAATGAVIGIVGGPIGVVVGAGIGAGVGAMGSANTTPKQVNLGNAPWDKNGT